MSSYERDLEELVRILKDIIKASDANDDKTVLLYIAKAKDWLHDLGMEGED